MRWLGRSCVLAVVMVAALFGVTAQAQAAVPPQNVGWLYTLSGSGAVYFDADLAGHPGWEKITVCDNSPDGRGIYASVEAYEDGVGWVSESILDQSYDRHCESMQGNYFNDGFYVWVQICEYWGHNFDNCAEGKGVA